VYCRPKSEYIHMMVENATSNPRRARAAVLVWLLMRIA
jgi:hypothetical protein